MADTKRVIIGSEADDSLKVDLKQVGATVILPMGTWDASGNQVSPGSALITKPFDYIGVVSTTLTDVFTYRSGGAAGTIVGTITITYTDSSKNTIESLSKV